MLLVLRPVESVVHNLPVRSVCPSGAPKANSHQFLDSGDHIVDREERANVVRAYLELIPCDAESKH